MDVIFTVFLLDVFNSLGLTTSTTVSLVFGLLGSAVCVAFFVERSEKNIDMTIYY